jgi:hypothetical protein
MSKNLIVTVDVYMFDYETTIDAIDKVMATLHAGGLEGDVLNTIEGEPDEAKAQNDWRHSAVRAAAGA